MVSKKTIKRESLQQKPVVEVPDTSTDIILECDQLTEIQVNCFLDGFRNCLKTGMDPDQFEEMVSEDKYKAVAYILLRDNLWVPV